MKIKRQEVIISFEVDQSIVLTCGSAIKNAQQKLGGEILTINTPADAPPSMPRIILKLKDAYINIGLDRIQITTIPPSHVSNKIEESSKFTLQRITPLLEELLDVIPKYLWGGVITELNYPEEPLKSKSSNQLATPIFDKLIDIDLNGMELSSFQLQYGIKDDQYFVTYTISTYEDRQVKVEVPSTPGQFIRLDSNDYVLTECGVGIILDTNNRPSHNITNPLEDIFGMLDKQETLINKITENNNLQGVI